MPLFSKSRLMRTLLRFVRNETGALGLTFALTLIPLIAIAGGAIDYARMIQYKSSLQTAVDEAALAGATAFSDSNQGAVAATVATDYFKRAILPASLTPGTPIVPIVTTNAGGSINPALGNAPAYTVTVTASVKVGTTLLSMFIPSVMVSATGTAGDPIVTAKLLFTNVNSVACDGNTVYLYQVPANSSGTGYDFTQVPVFNPATLTGFYKIGSNLAGQKGSVATFPTFSANQPLGVALRNDTNGNTVAGCGIDVTGANSYGAPSGASQMFYSSLLQAGESPSEQTNYSYTIKVNSTTTTISTTRHGKTTTTSSTVYNSASVTVPMGQACTTMPCSYTWTSTDTGTLATYLSINVPGNSFSDCLPNPTQQAGAKGSVDTTYRCWTQYRTASPPSPSSAASTASTASAKPNCSLYVQTGVTSAYINGLSNSSSAPAAALGNCFSVTDGGAQYAAPSCSQLSALADQSGSSAIAPAAVFWWDDAGGVGPGQQYYGPVQHCDNATSNMPGYGEDCMYKNNFFAAQCTVTGGSGSGFTEVVLTQ